MIFFGSWKKRWWFRHKKKGSAAKLSKVLLHKFYADHRFLPKCSREQRKAFRPREKLWRHWLHNLTIYYAAVVEQSD